MFSISACVFEICELWKGGRDLGSGCGAGYVCAVSLFSFFSFFVFSVCWCRRRKKELNNRMCVYVGLTVSGWSTAACCIIIACCPSPLTSYSNYRRGGEEEEGVRGKKGRGRENEWITEWIALCVRPCSLVVGLGYTDVLCSDCSLCRPTWIYIFTQGVFVTHPFGFFCIVRVFVFCLFFSLACLQSAWRHSWTFCRKCESHC